MNYKAISLILFVLVLIAGSFYFFQVSKIDILSWQIKKEGFSQNELSKLSGDFKSQLAQADSLDLIENNDLLSGFIKVEQIAYLPIKPALLVRGD